MSPELEFDSAGVLRDRYVHGAGADEPLLWYQDGVRRYLLPDRQGSIVAVTDAAGSLFAINRYDPWGFPGLNGMGRFRYTGQIWIRELGLYHYKARMYSPTLGRFLQTDPVGYEGGNNLYAYAANDPINLVDPLGERPGDPFLNSRDAALDWQNHTNPDSIRRNQEALGAIYRRDGRYYSTEPAWTREKGGTAEFTIPCRNCRVEDVHTHGDYSKESRTGAIVRTSRSEDQFDSDNPSPPDIARADGAGRPVTIGTPSGNYVRYDPQTGRTERIQPYQPTVAPQSPPPSLPPVSPPEGCPPEVRC